MRRFFQRREDFELESSFYQNESLRGALPPLHGGTANDNASVCSASGYRYAASALSELNLKRTRDQENKIISEIIFCLSMAYCAASFLQTSRILGICAASLAD